MGRKGRKTVPEVMATLGVQQLDRRHNKRSVHCVMCLLPCHVNVRFVNLIKGRKNVLFVSCVNELFAVPGTDVGE